MRKKPARLKLRVPHSPRFALFVFISVIAAIALFLAVLFFLTQQSPSEYIDNLTSLKDSGLRVPEPNEKSTEAGLAIPRSAQESYPGSKFKMRTFDLIAEKATFSINKIIVNQNDIVRIQLNALDNDYDISFPALGISQKVKKGQRKTVEFQAIADGTFVFSCQSCDGNRDSMKGILIVIPKS